MEGMMLKLKFQYFGHLMPRADSFEKTLMLGKIEGRRRRGQQRMRWLDGITNRTGNPGVLRSMGSQRVGHNLATEKQPPIRKVELLRAGSLKVLNVN